MFTYFAGADPGGGGRGAWPGPLLIFKKQKLQTKCKQKGKKGKKLIERNFY